MRVQKNIYEDDDKYSNLHKCSKVKQKIYKKCKVMDFYYYL